MKTNILIEALQQSYAQLALVQQRTSQLLQGAHEPADLSPWVQLADKLGRQVLAMEKQCQSPAMLRAAMLPFLQWLAGSQPTLAEELGHAYAQWLEQLQQA